ncbi:MAG: type II toxin-antitoxin system HicA family toxin [Candidatus Kapabacteria bacterium]|nr:type II toxin-antitoxin system HicA family toxin [Candidatus Kapabacteria bacterium]
MSGQEFIRLLERLGWQARRQTGSHVILSSPNGGRTIPVPRHRTLDKGLLHSLIKQAGMTLEEFRNNL